MENFILTNLAHLIFYLYTVVQKLLLILFLNWFELRSELANISMKGIKNGLINKMNLWIFLSVWVRIWFISFKKMWEIRSEFLEHYVTYSYSVTSVEYIANQT